MQSANLTFYNDMSWEIQAWIGAACASFEDYSQWYPDQFLRKTRHIAHMAQVVAQTKQSESTLSFVSDFLSACGVG